MLKSPAGIEQRTFHFSDLDNPTCYNLATVMRRLGWVWQSNAATAAFSDINLQLPSEAMQHLEYKHLLAELLKSYEGDFVPISYNIDDNTWSDVLNYITQTIYNKADKFVDEVPDLQWILKPSMLNNGERIYLFKSIAKLWDHYTMGQQRLGGPHVLQQYIQSPLLLQGKKNSLRLYVIMTTNGGVYLYPSGYINISYEEYRADCLEILSAHLTNEHLGGVMSNVDQKVTSQYPYFAQVQPQCIHIIEQVLRCFDKQFPKLGRHKIPTLGILGFDFLVDSNKKVWLLEINHGPHFPTTQTHPLTSELFAPFWHELVHGIISPLLSGNLKELGKAFITIKRRQSRWFFW